MGEVFEFISLGDKGSFTVELDDSSDTAIVDVGVDDTFASFAVTALLCLGETLLAHSFEGFIKVAISLDERLLGVGQTNTGKLFEFLDGFNANFCHFWLLMLKILFCNFGFAFFDGFGEVAEDSLDGLNSVIVGWNWIVDLAWIAVGVAALLRWPQTQ